MNSTGETEKNKEEGDKRKVAKKGRRVVRNNGRDIWGAYYQINRQYEKENREAFEKQMEETNQKGKKRPFNSTEKLFMTVIILGVIGLIIKYLVF